MLVSADSVYCFSKKITESVRYQQCLRAQSILSSATYQFSILGVDGISALSWSLYREPSIAVHASLATH
jgi:hypothetical protein